MTARIRSLSLLVGLLLGTAGCPTGPVECLRAINCVEACGGPVVQSGCAACPAGSFDDFLCHEDAATDGGSADSGASDGGGIDAPISDAPPPLDAPSTTDAPITASQVIGRACGPADGFALNLGLYGGATEACMGNPAQSSVTFFIHDLGGATLPPTAGATITSVEGAGSNGNASQCPGGSPPCRVSDTWSITFDTYTADVGATGSYSITWTGGETSNGTFDATWCESGPVICG